MRKPQLSRFGKGTKVWDRTGKEKGVMTGASRPCRLEGCMGIRVTVRWDSGGFTHPCTRALKSYYSGMKLV